MQKTLQGATDQLLNGIYELKDATSIGKDAKQQKLLSQIDMLLSNDEGISAIYQNMEALISSGILKNTPWEKFENLVPSLTGGTLKSGFPNNVYEMLSSLRVLAIANGKLSNNSHQAANDFLESMLVNNLDLIFNHPSEADRLKLTNTEFEKLQVYFGFMLNHLSLDAIKESLVDELDNLIAQRQIDTYKIRDIIQLVTDKLSVESKTEVDSRLRSFVKSVKSPSPLSTRLNYQNELDTRTEIELTQEAIALGKSLSKYGLATEYHVKYVLTFIESKPHLIPFALGLTSAGMAEWDKHTWFVKKLVKKTIESSTRQAIYGLRQVLERNLLSRNAVYNGLKSLVTIKVHPEIKRRLKRSHWSSDATPPLKTLLAGTLCILGQPLGIGQGLNPTCQSARGISLWSEHAPAKLINMIITVAEHNNIQFRFEGDIIESDKLLQGLAKSFDNNLDPVSIVLVPHLDKVYAEMMKRASLRTEDPHKWVNPALYGQWIPTGFVSCYNQMTATIHQFTVFLRYFIATVHPHYNGSRKLIYPIPVGIFITSAHGEMLGFHAVSILRIDWAPDKSHMRIYFLNPNNEGRQNWGQNIKPSVHKMGERQGESSLPFEEFASRLYAFHYPPMGIEQRLDSVDNNLIEKITELAKSSWGKAYSWTN